MNKPPKNIEKMNNIVRLEFDADFYIDRAVRAVNRCQYEKALKYFRVAIEKDSTNVNSYLNIAGLLAELGRFEESNEFLETLIYEIDPQLHSCLYYMANNLMGIGEFELAEGYLFQYLEREPEGEYITDAAELLEFLSFELGRSPDEWFNANQISPSSYLTKYEEDQYMLETGQYTKAKKILEDVLRESKPSRWGGLELIHSKEDPVIECVLRRMREYSKEQRMDAKKLWNQFVTNEPREITIRKAETWAAAVEYIISKNHGIPISQSDVAEKYDVSTSSIHRNVRRLQDLTTQ